MTIITIITIADTSDYSTISLSSSHLVYGVGISLSLTIAMEIRMVGEYQAMTIITIADTSDNSTISLSSSYLVYGVGLSLSLPIVMNIGVASIGQWQSSYCLHPSLGSIGDYSNIV